MIPFTFFGLQFGNKIRKNQLVDNKIISMWNVLASNKLLQQKQQDKDYQAHLHKLKNMKSTIQIQPPQQPPFVFIKPKTEMLRRDKLLMIDRENHLLNSKMIGIRNKEYKDNKLRPESQQLKTLNQVINNQQQVNIYRENQRICTKLLRIQTFYPTFQLLKQSQLKERVRNNISENARRSLSLRSNSAKKRPQSSSLTRSSKFYRSRVSKYDLQGNSSQQKINILYKLTSQEFTRPSTAPSIKKTQPIDRYPQGNNFDMPKMAATQQLAKEFQTNLPSEHQTQLFSPR